MPTSIRPGRAGIPFRRSPRRASSFDRLRMRPSTGSQDEALMVSLTNHEGRQGTCRSSAIRGTRNGIGGVLGRSLAFTPAVAGAASPLAADTLDHVATSSSLKQYHARSPATLFGPLLAERPPRRDARP